MDRPTAAPARFPYQEHRTLAEVDSETFEQRIREKARLLIELGEDELAVSIALRRALLAGPRTDQSIPHGGR